MRAQPVAAEARRPERAPDRGGFAAGLARERARASRGTDDARGSARAPDLLQRRRGALGRDDALGAEGELAAQGGVAGAPGEPVGMHDAPSHPPVAAPGALLGAAAVARVAVAVAGGTGARSVELRLAPALTVHLASTTGGVDLSIHVAGASAAAAHAELPALVAALRARGIRVARASVRPDARAAGALTPHRGSATTAPASLPGTVAKW